MFPSKFPTVTLISHTSSFINFLLRWNDDIDHVSIYHGMVRKCTASTCVQCLDDLCKNYISEQGHVLRYWVLEFQHSSLHNTHPVLPISISIRLLSLMVPEVRNLKVIWAYRDLCTLKSRSLELAISCQSGMQAFKDLNGLRDHLWEDPVTWMLAGSLRFPLWPQVCFSILKTW